MIFLRGIRFNLLLFLLIFLWFLLFLALFISSFGHKIKLVIDTVDLNNRLHR